MQNMLKFGLKTLFLLVVLLGVGAIYSIDQSQTYGRLINYVGIVRGATQRLVKLELAQEPHDDLIAYLDGIQDELRTGEGPYGLIRPDDLEYNNNLSQLQRLWGTLKEDILAARQDKTASAALLRASEDYFDLANKTVFHALAPDRAHGGFSAADLAVHSLGLRQKNAPAGESEQKSERHGGPGPPDGRV